MYSTQESAIVPPLARQEIMAKIVTKRRIAQNVFEMVFHAPSIAYTAQAGQYVEILYGQDYAPLLRRPFSIYRVDRAQETFSILFLARGSFTSGLSQKRRGSLISIIGPLGRPFQWDTVQPRQHILVAGGIGAPPLYFLAETLHNARAYRDVGDIVVLNGARTRSLLIGIAEFSRLNVHLYTMTDDGTHGEKGLVTDRLRFLLEQPCHLPRTLYACGPNPMLKTVATIANEFRVPCQVSVETSMPCGIGFCNGCVVAQNTPQGTHYVRACWEGPVFDANTLVW
ncbi:dihydroorotate oxidase B, electron transfer subunit [Chthonomonas calidirosea]|uniref:dihydroorotate dehydrogenase electron transfer subunit n=1 Tax=Chthonomonas calidirosea TaxID=454171 RepID=UPI0006DD43CA|nr:dihydroorotate dehydrogenase electron transfer subunit [Chthonomonas calidirosea]CEK14308.1 dihydroorotate oxidase B, electron transfer subunit [Chthonomonas calidirosea]